MILWTSAVYSSDSNNAFLPPANQRFLLHMAVEGALTLCTVIYVTNASGGTKAWEKAEAERN